MLLMNAPQSGITSYGRGPPETGISPSTQPQTDPGTSFISYTGILRYTPHHYPERRPGLKLRASIRTPRHLAIYARLRKARERAGLNQAQAAKPRASGRTLSPGARMVSV